MRTIKTPLIFLAIVFVLGFLFLFASPSKVHARQLMPGCYTFGDVNNVGGITNADATEINNYIAAGDITILTAPKLRADVNDSGEVDPGDALLILQYVGDPNISWPVCSTPEYKPLAPCHPTGNAYDDSSAKVNKFDYLRILEQTAGWNPTWLPTELEDADVQNHGREGSEYQDGPQHHSVSSTSGDLRNIFPTDATVLGQYLDGSLEAAGFNISVDGFDTGGNGFKRCPALNVNSSPASGAAISGTQPGTGGTTNYSKSGFNITTNLTAGVLTGYNFSSWSGSCSGGNPCVISTIYNDLLDLSKTVTANYTTAVLPAPTGLSSISACTSATLSWSAVSGATGYKVYYWNGSSWSLLATTASTSYNWTGLSQNTGYSWRVSAYNGSGEGPVADYVSFTTITCGSNVIHVRSTKDGFSEQGAFIQSANPWLVSGTTDYDIVRPQTQPLQGVLLAPPTFGTANFENWTGCDDNAYSGERSACWVDASNPSGGETQTVTANYTSVCVDTLPAAASNPSPGDGATNVPVTTNLGWTFNGWGTWCAGNYNGWHLYLGTSNPPPIVIQEQDPIDPAVYNPAGDLNANTTYYWRITKCNNGRAWNCTDSPVWSFTTVGPPDLDDLPPRVYHTSGPYAGETVSSTRPANPSEALRGQITYWENTDKPQFQFDARWWSDIGSVDEGTCNNSGTWASGLLTNGRNSTTHDVYFDAPGSPGTYYFYEYLDADGSTPICAITEGSETNNVEGVSYEVVSSPPPGVVSITCSITPSTLNVGDDLTISATITNGSATTIQTQSPYSGYVYTEGQYYGDLGFGDIQDRYRIAADLAGDLNYPNYRWGWGTSANPNATLNSGSSTTITGKITMTTAGTKTAQIGLVKEGVAWLQTNQCQTTVTVGTSPPDLNDLEPHVYHRSGPYEGQTVTSGVSPGRPAEPNEPLRGVIRFAESTDKPQFTFNARWWGNISGVDESTCFTTNGNLASGILTNGNNATDYGDELAEEENMYFNAPATAGNYNFYEYLDADGTAPACALAELLENNNVESVAYDVGSAGALPDLRINTFELRKYDVATPSCTETPIIPAVVTAGEQVCFYAKITNVGASVSIYGFIDSFFVDSSVEPPCDDSSYREYELVLRPFVNGQVHSWSAGPYTVPLTGPATAQLHVDSFCDLEEQYEVNVGGNFDGPDNHRSITYSIGTTNWLQAIGGDVGAFNRIDMSNPGNNRQTNYLLIGRDIGNASSDRWKVNNYNQPLVPTGGVYDYFDDRFGVKARANIRDCNTESIPTGLSYCGVIPEYDLSAEDVSRFPPDKAVIFIDGNLKITENINIGSRSVVFVVSGNIVVSDAVNRIDGIYIAGGDFADCLSSCGSAGSTLVVNGSVYAKTMFVNGNRTLASGGDTNPSLIVNFEPKYLITMNDLLGSPSIVWREVAP